MTPPSSNEPAWRRATLDDPEAARAWDDDLRRTAGPFPGLYHSAAWLQLLGEIYGITGCSLAEAGGARFVLHRARPGGWLGCAHAPYGGIWTPASDIPAATPRLPEPAALAAAGIRAFRLRTVEPVPAAPQTLAAGGKVAMWLPLPEGDAEVLWKSFPAKVRNQVRKAEKEGVTVAAGRDDEFLDAFYQLYARRMHEFGTPAHGRPFFRALLRRFPDAELIVCRHQDTPAAAVLDIPWGAWRVNLYGAADTARRALCANNLVYWESLRRACQGGCAWYDFSRSTVDSGQYRFKAQWGAAPRRIGEWRVAADSATAGGWQLTETAAGAGERSLAARIWRLLPAAVTDRLGPRVRALVP